MRHEACGAWCPQSEAYWATRCGKVARPVKVFPRAAGRRLQVHYTQVSGAICRRICICISLSLSLCSVSVAASSFIIILVSGISSGRHLHRSTNCVKADGQREAKAQTETKENIQNVYLHLKDTRNCLAYIYLFVGLCFWYFFVLLLFSFLAYFTHECCAAR